MMARRPPAPHRRIRAARPWVEHVDPWARSHRSELMWRLARLLVGLVASAASLAAQDAPPVELAVRDDGSLAVEVGDLFSDGRLRQALHEGLPLRLRMEATLWRDGLFDQQVQSERWQASLFFDPVMQRYIMRIGDREPIQASRLDEATMEALRSVAPVDVQETVAFPANWSIPCAVMNEDGALSAASHVFGPLNGAVGA